MKKSLKMILCCMWLLALLYACNTDVESEFIQKPLTADSQYYQNLRNYKKSDHPICFGWYAGYSNVESPSMADHFIGLPDSMDIVSLWAGIPSGKNWDEMQYIREVKGTKVLLCSFTHIDKAGYPRTEEGIKDFAMSLVNEVNKYDLDGLDLDYEPEGDWLKDEHLVTLLKHLSQHVGPKSDTGRLLTVNFGGKKRPYPECEPYVDYFIEQMYGTGTDTQIQARYDYISSWCPPEKYVPAEWLGNYPDTGGVPFVEEKNRNNKFDSWGNPLYSVIGMARWNPTQGKKGGFATYYFEYEYNTIRPANQSIGDKEANPIPYYSLIRGIQEQSPALR